MKTKGAQILWLQRHGGSVGMEGGCHPRGARERTQGIGNNRDIGLPLRKRVSNRMKLLGLQGCDREGKGLRRLNGLSVEPT